MNEVKCVGDWSEQDVVQCIANFHESNFLRFGGASFCHKIIKTLQRSELLVENAGHACLPPDYYSEELNIMFDVMRVNDSEKRRGYNPVFQEMSAVSKEVKRKMSDFGLNEKCVVVTDLKVDNGLDYDDIHQFKYYKKHVVRVLNEHIRKLSIWKSEHPSITRKGFVVLDEAGLYFRGYAPQPFVVSDSGFVSQWFFLIERPITVHFPWNDEEFLRPLLNADLDFVIWYRPYVAFSQGNRNLFDGKCADLAVIDVRYKNSLSLQSYDIADNWFSWQ